MYSGCGKNLSKIYSVFHVLSWKYSNMISMARMSCVRHLKMSAIHTLKQGLTKRLDG